MSIDLSKIFKKTLSIAICVFLVGMVLVSANAVANKPENQKLNIPSENKNQNVDRAEDDSGIDGPHILGFIRQAELIIPENTRFIPSETVGGRKNPGMRHSYLGTIEPKSDDQTWHITVNYIPTGHIDTSEAITWDVKKMFADMINQNEIENKYRAEDNERLMEFIGNWLIEPKFDYSSHVLRYAYLKKFVGSPVTTARYVSILLGREGYFSLDLFTGDEEFKQDKKYADNIFSTLHFKKGKRYSDYLTGDRMVASFGVDRLVSEVEPEIYVPPDRHTVIMRLLKGFVFTLPITFLFIYIGFIKDYLKPEKLNRLKETFATINKNRNKYFLIWSSMIALVFGINLLAVSFNIPKNIYYVLAAALYYPYFVAIVRLTAYGSYDRFLYIFPSLNLKVIRAFALATLALFIVFVPVGLAVMSYKIGNNNVLISPLIGLVAAACFVLIAFYLCARLIFAWVAVCLDNPNPIKTSWNISKGYATRILIILSVIGCCIAAVNAFIPGVKSVDLFNDIVINNPATYFKALLSISITMTLRIGMHIIYAITGIIILGIRNEQISQ
jgi:uncharacterized membrane-anchored protein